MRGLLAIACLVGLLAVAETASVAVLGGGVSGLTAAQELVERGFDVQVYERQDVFGGKARSYKVEGTGKGGRSDLPGEHGFRIFWNYYLNMYDTLKRIRFNEDLTVFDYMHRISNNLLAAENGSDIYFDFGPQNWRQFLNEWKNLSTDAHLLSREEMDFAIRRSEILMSACAERMREEFERFSFGEFIGAEYRSKTFTKYWLNLLHLGGIDPYQANLGATANYLQSLNSPMDDDIAIQVLKAPTKDAWIDPWVKQMTEAGAAFHPNHEIKSFTCSGNSIQSVFVKDLKTGLTTEVKADYFVFAVPVDRMERILDNSQCGPISLQQLNQLETTWMVGMQYYLHKDVEITDGFTLYLDSPWRLSSVSFRQWWPTTNWSSMGDGTVGGIISAIISNFTTPGILFGKPAVACNHDEIKQEVWAQIKTHLNQDHDVLDDRNLAGFSLDTSMSFENGVLENEEPMFFSSPGSWANSPDSATDFSNMFVCGDYVRAMSRVTPSGMEAANESARRAVNALLAASHSKEKPCKIFEPPRNPDFALLRALDQARYKLGLPHMGCKDKGCVATA